MVEKKEMEAASMSIRERFKEMRERSKSSVFPYGNRLVVEHVDLTEQSASGVIIPNKQKPRKSTKAGRVIAVGKRYDKESNTWSDNIPEIAEGDIVLFGDYNGTEVAHTENVFIIGDNEILGIVDKEHAEEMMENAEAMSHAEREAKKRATVS